MMSSFLKSAAGWVLTAEPLWLILMLLSFWYPSPIRDQWLWLLLGLPITLAARWIVYRRLWTRFPLDTALLAFIALSLINIFAAPFRRVMDDRFYSWIVLMGRPLLSMALCLYAVEYARLRRKLDGLLSATLVLGLLVAVLALTASQWTSKSDPLRFLLDSLPRFLSFPGAEGGFNVNEIAGALAWLTPLAAGLAFLTPASPKWVRWGFGSAFGLSFLALFLGQSRFALVGTLLSLFVLVPMVIQSRRNRWISWVALGGIAVLEALIVLNVFNPLTTSQRVARDEDSLSVRFDIWASAGAIIGDHALTGVGMNMFRDHRVRDLYPVPNFDKPVLSHTHNELLQIATDLGLPGLALFTAWHAVLAGMLFRCYQKGDKEIRVIAAAVGAGLLAHAVFGLGDAIPVWDRFAFVYGWLMALGAALHNRSANQVYP